MDVSPVINRVARAADKLALPHKARRYAKKLARRAVTDSPITRTPRVIAGGALYAAVLHYDLSVTQGEVCEATGASRPVVKNCYDELEAHIDINVSDDPDADDIDSYLSW